MISIAQMKIPILKDDLFHLKKKIGRILHISEDEIHELEILRKSVDARKKDEPYFVYTAAVSLRGGKKTEEILLLTSKNKDVTRYKKPVYSITKIKDKPKNPPVVVGMGPAGLFCAYALSLAGLNPILLERGKPVEKRTADVHRFWDEGLLDESSNVLFGEGGAGTFSDGKLNTLGRDKTGRNRFVLETFVKFGADSDILYDYKPHIGTDALRNVIADMRKDMLRMGAEIRYESRVSNLLIKDRYLTGLEVNEDDVIPCTQAVLAIGHSARDTFFKLMDLGISMTGKEFAVGFRIEHPQSLIDESQYGAFAEALHPANYKLATRLSNGRGVYSFCMCPGGYVVNASSEEGMLAVNGMSYHGRDSKNANSAIVVSVGQKEFDVSDPKAAISYQRSLEQNAFALGKGKIPQQLLGDYKRGIPSSSYGGFSSLHKGDACFADLSILLGEGIKSSFLEGMEQFAKKIAGFDHDETILSGVESRTSSPVRILRDETFQSNVLGLYPCGEGAGYAGGIMSAAMDGLKVAEKIIESYLGDTK